jgi:5-hydroxyisourate hydrolase-like protein (transthyretin family)
MNSEKNVGRRGRWLAAGLLVTLSGGAVVPFACTQSEPPRAVAYKVESREQLVGGRRALGEVGDYKLSNGIIQIVIQDVGHSRGFGAFGGSLIDIDLVRNARSTAATGPAGNDQFTEMFPAFFLEAMEPQTVEVLEDGRSGDRAVVRVSGHGNQFLSLATSISDVVLGGAELGYQVDYILERGKQYVTAEVTVINRSKDKAAQFPLEVPTGFITLLGAGQKLFVPGKAGYDMRFRLDEVYAQPADLNALPGEVAEMVATEGQGTSYAVAAAPVGASYLLAKPDFYPTAKRDSMLIPLAYSSFLGTYWAKLPPSLGPGKTFTYAALLAVGAGDIASAQKVIYDLKEQKVGRISGRVREEGTGQPVDDVAVVLQDDKGNYLSSARTRDGGRYVAWVPKGRYRAVAVGEHRTPKVTGDYVDVSDEGGVNVDLTVERQALLSVRVTDSKGRPMPAKVSVEGVHELPEGGGLPWTHLYNLKVGEKMRQTDFVPDSDSPESRRYLETHFFVNHGRGGEKVRPGRYTVYVSRGPEYDLAKVEVELKAGQEQQVSVVLNHVVPTPGWVSGDFHVHSEHSVDSNMSLADRVLSYAAEGVDYVAATDHNYVTDLRPTVDALGLTDWLATSVGLELTTLEMGHFNAWPLTYAPGPVTHGAFDWFRRKPADLFAQIRSMASLGPDRVLIQVNHPRSTIMGYFNGFNLSSYLMEPLPPATAFSLDQNARPGEDKSPYHYSQFSWDFNVLEVFNGKRQDELRHYVIPEVAPPGPEPTAMIPPPGTVLTEIVKRRPDASCPTSGDFNPEDCVLQPKYPGTLDDWYALLAQGRKVTGVGNSDSHDDEDEAGLPRTYLYVGKMADGSMRGFDEGAAVEALLAQRAVVTNGPFVEFEVDGQMVGSRVVSPTGEVTARIRVQAADWVDVSRVVLLRGGKDRMQGAEVLKTWDRAAMKDGVLRFDEAWTGVVPDGSFLTVEVSGEKSMWPVFTPREIPSIAIGEAVGAIGSAFGYTDKYGKYMPIQTQAVTPFAFTNPIFVDRAVRQSLVQPVRMLPLGPGEDAADRAPRRIGDLRKLLGAFHGM